MSIPHSSSSFVLTNFFGHVSSPRFAQAWQRLCINLEKLSRHERALSCLGAACEDSFVGGGEKLDLQQRFADRHRKHGAIRLASCDSSVALALLSPMFWII